MLVFVKSCTRYSRCGCIT